MNNDDKILCNFFDNIVIRPPMFACSMPTKIFEDKDNIMIYRKSQYHIYSQYLEKLNREDLNILINKSNEILKNTKQEFIINLKYIAIGDMIGDRITNIDKLFLIIPEIVKILILDYQFPTECFPDVIINMINKNLSYKSARN